MDQTIGKFFKLIQPEKKQLYQVYSYALFNGLIALSLPLGIQTILGLLQGGRVSSAWLVLILIIIAGITLAGILQLLQLRILETIQQKLFTRAAFDFAYRIPKIEFEDLHAYYPPELMNRFFEVPVLQKSISKVLLEIPAAVLQIFFALIVLSFYHPFFIAFSLILLLFVTLVIALTAKQGLKASLKESKHKFKVASWLEELARVKNTFHLSGSTDLHLNKMNTLATNYVEAREAHYRILRFQYILLLIFKIFISASLLLVGGYLVLTQKLNIGQFVAAEIIVLLIISSSEKLILNFDTIYDVLTSLEKIHEVSSMKLQQENPDQTISPKDPDHAFDVELHKVSFQYPGDHQMIIQDSSCLIAKGENVCISGKNGSGNSTLLQLISGLFKPTKGNILINGFHIGSYDRETLYRYFGTGLQDESIFEGTLAENITLGRDHITTSDLLWAVNRSGLDDFVRHLPYGLNTMLELSGKRLPESIYHKIIIARSIVNRPKLLLMEIPIDRFEKNEREKIIDFLTDKSNGWTLIFISADDYFVRKADRVLKIENAKIVSE